jgi:hypothetical protein
LNEVAVDGVTIIGNGTPSDPLSAIGAGGGAIPADSDLMFYLEILDVK